MTLGQEVRAGAPSTSEVPVLGHPAPVRGLPAQMNGGVNVREKFGESLSAPPVAHVDRRSPQLIRTTLSRSPASIPPSTSAPAGSPLVDGEATSACLVALWIGLALEIRAGGLASTLTDHRRFPGLDLAYLG